MAKPTNVKVVSGKLEPVGEEGLLFEAYTAAVALIPGRGSGPVELDLELEYPANMAVLVCMAEKYRERDLACADFLVRQHNPIVVVSNTGGYDATLYANEPVFNLMFARLVAVNLKEGEDDS